MMNCKWYGEPQGYRLSEQLIHREPLQGSVYLSVPFTKGPPSYITSVGTITKGPLKGPSDTGVERGSGRAGLWSHKRAALLF